MTFMTLGSACSSQTKSKKSGAQSCDLQRSCLLSGQASSYGRPEFSPLFIQTRLRFAALLYALRPMQRAIDTKWTQAATSKLDFHQVCAPNWNSSAAPQLFGTRQAAHAPHLQAARGPRHLKYYDEACSDTDFCMRAYRRAFRLSEARRQK